MAAARRVLLLKGDDPHDYKFSAAVFEDYPAVSPAWRERCLAAQRCAASRRRRSRQSARWPAFGRRLNKG